MALIFFIFITCFYRLRSIWRKLIYVIVCCDLTFHHDYTIDYLHESDNIMENENEWHKKRATERDWHYGRSRKKIQTLLKLRRGTFCYYTWLYYWRFFLEILIGKYLHTWHVLYWTFILFTSKGYFHWRKPPVYKQNVNKCGCKQKKRPVQTVVALTKFSWPTVLKIYLRLKYKQSRIMKQRKNKQNKF